MRASTLNVMRLKLSAGDVDIVNKYNYVNG